MDKLTKLVLDYQKTKSQIILKEILEMLNPVIKKKANYVFYVKWYPFNLYHPCKFCRTCTKLNNIPKTEHKILCEDCEECKCIKGFFNLNKNHLCEYEDVEQDLLLVILQMIDKFTPEKEFNNYLYTTLWEWMPTFFTKDFVKSLSNKSLTQEDEEGNETQIDISEENKERKLKPSIQEILKVCKTDIEKKVCELYLENPNLSQAKIAEKLGTYQRDISRIINKLRKRLKKFV
jgi:RNA polymerase sigma factor (sigma-70 family)